MNNFLPQHCVFQIVDFATKQGLRVVCRRNRLVEQQSCQPSCDSQLAYVVEPVGSQHLLHFNAAPTPTTSSITPGICTGTVAVAPSVPPALVPTLAPSVPPDVIPTTMLKLT